MFRILRVPPRAFGSGLLLVAALGTIPHRAGAQAVPNMRAGQWVRISTKFEGVDPDWMLAQLRDLTPAYLVVDPLGASTLAIMRGSLTRVQLFRGWIGREDRGTLLGTWAGMAVFIASRVIVDCPRMCLAAIPAGALVGRRIGSSASGYGWEIVPVDQLDAAFAPRRVARVRIGATLSF